MYVTEEDQAMLELVFAAFVIFYIVPFSVACFREHHATSQILLANVLLGWTIIGWWAVLYWAYATPAKTERSRARDHPEYLDLVNEPKVVMPRILHNFTTS